VVTPEAKRTVVRFWREGMELSERRACRLIGLDRSTHRYLPRMDDNGELRQRLRELAEQRRRFGYRRLHVLLCREGRVVNKKRVQRLYRTGRSIVARPAPQETPRWVTSGVTGACGSEPTLVDGFHD
jgi:putative transposase